MRRTLTFVALWLLAGAAAATVAWLGVSSVSDELAGSASHPGPLSAEEVQAEVAAGASTTTTAGTPTTEPTTTTVVGATPTTATTAPNSPTTTTTRPPVAATTRSYDLVGGNVTLRFSPTSVTVVVATPAPGFSVDIGTSHDGGAKVEFEGEGHNSQVEGWWDGGPQDDVREDGDD